jgi:hypothetical protein
MNHELFIVHGLTFIVSKKFIVLRPSSIVYSREEGFLWEEERSRSSVQDLWEPQPPTGLLKKNWGMSF